MDYIRTQYCMFMEQLTFGQHSTFINMIIAIKHYIVGELNCSNLGKLITEFIVMGTMSITTVTTIKIVVLLSMLKEQVVIAAIITVIKYFGKLGVVGLQYLDWQVPILLAYSRYLLQLIWELLGSQRDHPKYSTAKSLQPSYSSRATQTTQ